LSKVSAPQGRSLSKSVAVGLLLAAIFLASLLLYKELFIVFLSIATAIGAWELSTALREKKWYVPRVPAVVGSVLIMPATYFGGPAIQWLASIAIVAALIVWRTVHLLFERRKANFQTSEAHGAGFWRGGFPGYLPATDSELWNASASPR
jgi:phosphatidate cytidylyltransferase